MRRGLRRGPLTAVTGRAFRGGREGGRGVRRGRGETSSKPCVASEGGGCSALASRTEQGSLTSSQPNATWTRDEFSTELTGEAVWNPHEFAAYRRAGG